VGRVEMGRKVGNIFLIKIVGGIQNLNRSRKLPKGVGGD